jgi:hypothetical protein
MHTITQDLMSLVIQLILFIAHHQHYLIRHYGQGHRPRIFRHLEMLRADLAWLLQHMPASNVISG